MIKKISLGGLVVLILACLFLTGFTPKKRIAPETVYYIYLDGTRIGTIKDRKVLEAYIDKQQHDIKEKYNVENVYLPLGLMIEKDVVYHPTFTEIEDVYKTLQDEQKSFTVKGYVVNIKGKDKTTKINVLDKDIFIKAVDETMRVFLDADQYKKYLTNSQESITGNKGRIIENVYIDQDVTYQEAYISTNETIFTDEKVLAKYLLYGTLEESETYTVKENDSMQSIADAHNLNIKEFLIANPDISGDNPLLFKDQVVNVGLIKPQIDVVLEEHVVDTVDTDYRTNIVYDNNILVGYSYTKVKGERGSSRITQKVKTINGEPASVVVVDKVEIKPAVDATVVKGGRYSSTVGDATSWYWPTKIPYCLTSGYGPRWGSFHDTQDISCTGYGSPIYAANNGVVDRVWYDDTGGKQITINHNNGYYTLYAHLSAQYVRPGQIVSRGQTIGAMGKTGYVTGTHLHFAIWVGKPYRGGYHTDPMKYRYN